MVRAFGEKKPLILLEHVKRVSHSDIALPSVVVAEILGGRYDFARKASLEEAPWAHRQLLETQKLLARVGWISEASSTSDLNHHRHFKSSNRQSIGFERTVINQF